MLLTVSQAKQQAIEALPPIAGLVPLLDYLFSLPPQATVITLANLRSVCPNESNDQLFKMAAALGAVPHPLLREKYELFWPGIDEPLQLTMRQAHEAYATNSYTDAEGNTLPDAAQFVSPYFTPTPTLRQLLVTRSAP